MLRTEKFITSLVILQTFILSNGDSIPQDEEPQQHRADSTLQKRSTNANPRFGRWTDADGSNVVRYIISSVYDPSEQQTIQNAMYQMESDLSGCVTFQPYHKQHDHGKPHIYITPTPRGKSDPGMCYSSPGRDLHTEYGQAQEVIVSRIYHKYGCTHNQRGIMGVLANLLGKRDEHRRPDRDYYINMELHNIDTNYIFLPHSREGPYDKYERNVDVVLLYPYDYCSVTHAFPNYLASRHNYGRNSTRYMFSVLQSPYYIPSIPKLSYHDCLALATLYKCTDRYGLCYDLQDCRFISINVTASNSTSNASTISYGYSGRGYESGYNSYGYGGSGGGYYNSYSTSTTTTTTTSTTSVPTTTPPGPIAPPGGRDLVGGFTAKPSNATTPNICLLSFRADDGVQTADGTLYLFSGNYYYIIDKNIPANVVDGPTLITTTFAGISGGPIRSAYTNANNDLLTHIVDGSGMEYTFSNGMFVGRVGSNPTARKSFALTDFSGTRRLFQITADKMGILHDGTTNSVASRFPPFTSVDAVVSYTDNNGEQLVMAFSGDMVSTFRFCDTDNPNNACFELIDGPVSSSMRFNFAAQGC